MNFSTGPHTNMTTAFGFTINAM